MSEEIKERLEAMAKVMPPSFYGTVTGALALITSLTAELVSRLNASRDSLKQLNIGEYTLIRSARDVMADAANALDAYDKTMQRIAEEPSALTHRQAAALIRSAPAPGREEIARVVDPKLYAKIDQILAGELPGLLPNGWTAQQYVESAYAEERRASLAKADAILALFHAPAEAGGGENKGAVRTAGAKLLTALERYGFPVSDAASTAAMSVEARDLHNAARRFKIAITSIMRPADEPAVTNGQ